MKKLMETDEAYRKIDRNAARVLRECANISLDIDSNQEVIDVCQAWREERELVAQETAILTTIETLRDIDFSEPEIQQRIMAKYNLNEGKAAEYMLKKSA